MTFDLETLKLAFSRTLLDEISRADQQLLAEEVALVERLAPTSRLREAGLVDADGRRTAAFDRACAEALAHLPGSLPLGERLELVSSFLDLCLVDGELHRDESSLLYLGARMLGVDAHTFDRHLDSLADRVGTLELDDPE